MTARSDAGRQQEPVRPRSALFTRSRRWFGLRIWLWLLAIALAACVWDVAASAQNSAAEDAKPESAVATAGGENDQSDEGHAAEHKSPLAPVLMGVLIILLMAKLAGDLFERIGMPAVLGELCVGIVLGNLSLFGWEGLEFLKAPHEINVKAELDEFEADIRASTGDQAANRERFEQLRTDLSHLNPYNTGAIIKMLAGIGVVLLLFEVGLESNVRDMLAVGASSMIVAVLGVIAPMALGYGVGIWLLPQSGWQVHLFVGATLCATSVGITARVFKDLGRSQQRESRIVLGAAVIDDVLGLIVLAIVSGVIQQGSNFDPTSLVWIVLKAVGFLFGAIVLGTRLFARPLFLAASALNGHGLLVVTALVICFGFGWLASVVGLDPIVGAFAAGLILDRAHYQELSTREDHQLEDVLKPLTAVLVPIFFVQMGIMVELKSFADPSVWGLAAALTFVAILGKQVCAFGVVERGLNRLAVGLGMIPRGEVGLIFAAVGMSLKAPSGEPIIVGSTYSALVVMVILTTMITPPLLKWGMGRKDGGGSPNAEPHAA